jgi:hypothetical protein
MQFMNLWCHFHGMSDQNEDLEVFWQLYLITINESVTSRCHELCVEVRAEVL